MDTHDVSNVDHFTRFLRAQEATLKAAQSREGEIPRDRQSRDALVQVQEMTAMRYMMQKKGMEARDEGQVQTSFLPPPYPPSTASLKDMTPIYIKDLRLGIHHRGNYVLVRSVSMATRMTAILFIVEDTKGEGVILQLYQQPNEDFQPTKAIAKKGDVFIIKEPFFKIMADGGYGLRVDHVSDLLRIDGRHELCPQPWISGTFKGKKTADSWKQVGNAAVGRKEYWTAIESYTIALATQPSPAEEAVIRLNRALANLQDGNFNAALANTQCLGPNPNTSEKALYRAGKALYNLGRFSESCKIFQTLFEKYPFNLEAGNELARSRHRLSEQQTGNYDFKALYKEIDKNRPPHLDHATYSVPVVVKDTPKRGQGLFTTKPVKAGDLLLCEKAFAHCYAKLEEENAKGGFRIGILMNLHTKRATMGTQSDLITAIVQKLMRNPSLIPDFTALHHGSYESVGNKDADGTPVIDTFLVERIISLNAFGAPLTTKGHLQAPAPEKPENEDVHHSTGIWSLASKINHSCISNCRRSFIGDLQIVRATCDIPVDTELTFWYKVPTGDYEEMKKGLENWGFECTCEVCLDSKNTPKKQLKKRKALFGDLKITLDAANVNIPKAERILNSIGQTYRSGPADVPRLEMVAPYYALTLRYNEQIKPLEVILMVLKALESAGFVIKGAKPPFSAQEPFKVEKLGILEGGVLLMWVLLWNCYVAVAPKLLDQVAHYGKLTYKMCMGEDVTFQETLDKRGEFTGSW